MAEGDPKRGELPAPITWRGIVLQPIDRWTWLSADRLWRVTTFMDAGYFMAYLQIGYDPFGCSGDTPGLALDALALQAAGFAEVLAAALRQIQDG